MVRFGQRTPSLLAAAATCFFIFALDAIIPMGYAAWLLYLLPLFMLSDARTRDIYLISGLCAALIFVGTFIPATASFDVQYAFSRFAGIVTLWIIAVFINTKNRSVCRLLSLQKDLEQTNAILESFFASSPGILNLLDDKLRYLNSDPMTPQYFNLTREQLKGRLLEELAPEYMQLHGAMLRTMLETGEALYNKEIESPVSGKPGETVCWRASYFPVPLAEGKPA